MSEEIKESRECKEEGGGADQRISLTGIFFCQDSDHRWEPDGRNPYSIHVKDQ